MFSKLIDFAGAMAKRTPAYSKLKEAPLAQVFSPELGQMELRGRRVPRTAWKASQLRERIGARTLDSDDEIEVHSPCQKGWLRACCHVQVAVSRGT